MRAVCPKRRGHSKLGGETTTICFFIDQNVSAIKCAFFHLLRIAGAPKLQSRSERNQQNSVSTLTQHYTKLLRRLPIQSGRQPRCRGNNRLKTQNPQHNAEH
mmetsp:Transcript_28988/g.29359  ORF Transcript_28988/g.29359 Transcript_28988/m.29359 type:complete len:102 (+) Transcript_28988:619-924(+)